MTKRAFLLAAGLLCGAALIGAEPAPLPVPPLVLRPVLAGHLPVWDIKSGGIPVIGSGSGSGGGVTIGTSTITGGTSGKLLYDNAGVVGEVGLGTTTTTYHGNAAGVGSFGAVVLTTDVSGILPGDNGGTGNGFFAVTGPTTSLKTMTFPNASSTVVTGTGTTNTLPKTTGTGTQGNSTITDDATTVTVNTATTLKSTTDSAGTFGFLNVSGTMPSSQSAATWGVSFSCTGAGSGSGGALGCLRVQFPAGYTGANYLKNAYFTTNSLPTSTFDGLNINATIVSEYSANTTGDVAAVKGDANNGSGGGFGVMGYSRAVASGKKSIAGYFAQSATSATSAPQVAVLASSGGTSVPTLPSTPVTLVVDDFGVTSTDPVWINESGTAKFKVIKGGATWGANSKTLTETTATAFAQFAIASGSSGGGQISYCVEANDGTKYQSECGDLAYAAINEAGTITCSVSVLGTEASAVSAATTLTTAFTCADAGSGNLQIKANSTSSLTQTLLRINYRPEEVGNVSVAFTPL